ncbi:prolyl oligopeptidase family serine peptidase [Allokutzneria sp. A3M-2-11 16]|uniref:S9 family peptidase n=1 Tax=Allokutzneria sp. A3M-2-11 16 TaxID=2962043 RepID=UPI0020B8EC99|nr:prolyl oligopeptidase family serine peptidase [Allokutzneria sp. A3M-2-11 16]MCP3802897.1 prolyl oligopeptidase family serine peptidase [Allokutzneria sp. A3M-2-11 16]
MIFDDLGGFAPSPDGALLAYISDASGSPQPWCLRLDGGEAPRLSEVDGTVTRLAWRPDGSRLLVQVDPDGAENYRLAEIDLDSGAVEWLTSADTRVEIGVPYASSGDPYSPDGRLLAYASNARDSTVFDVLVRDLTTGAVTTVLQAGVEVSEDRYLPMFFSPDSRALLVLRLHQNTEHDLFVCHLDNGAIEHITPHEGPAKFLPAAWSADGIYVCTSLDRDHTGLALLKADASLEWLATPEHDIDGAALSPDGSRLVWGVNVATYTQLEWLNPKTGERGTVDGLPRCVAMQEFGYDGQTAHLRGDELFVLVSRPTAAKDAWSVNLATGRARQLTDSGPDLPDDLVEPEVVRFPSADGRTVHGLLYRPRGVSRAGVVVDVHGGPEHQTRPWFSSMTQALLARGIGVLATNIRGSSGYGLSYQRLIYRDWGGGDLDDLAGAAAYLNGLSWVDGQRLGVFGASYGGFAALSCVTRLPQLWRAGVSICGVSDLVNDVRTFPPTWRRRAKDWLGDPDDPADLARLREASPYLHAHRLRAPLLLVHGINDTRVSIKESDRMYARLVELDLPVKLVRVDGEGHVVADRDTKENEEEMVVNWFARHLAP